MDLNGLTIISFQCKSRNIIGNVLKVFQTKSEIIDKKMIQKLSIHEN